MKKIFGLVICFVLLVSGFATADANQIGSVIGHTLYTDIVASINDYDIESFNINGYTAVVAEDLRNYGFDVVWYPEERALYISRAARGVVTSSYSAPWISEDKIGQVAHSVLYTDIRTYINGNEVESYNIDGRTIIYFNDLAAFGEVSYDNYSRRITLSAMGLTVKPLTTEDNIGDWWIESNDLKDNYGNVYGQAIYPYGNNSTYEILCNKKYTGLRGGIYVAKGYSDSESSVVVIKADDRVIYTSPEIDKTTAPVYFDVDIAGCNDLKIIASSSLAENLHIGNAELY